MRRSARRLQLLAAVALTGALCFCDGARDVVVVTRPVVTSAPETREVTTDLGWTVRVHAFRVALQDLEMTTGGETHASLLDPLSKALLGRAHAHPGHAAGGEVVGELQGRFVVDLLDDGAPIGTAELVATRYDGANFTFVSAGVEDGLDAADPLAGHAAFLEGEATKAGETVAFSAAVDQDEGRKVVGAVFAHEVVEGAAERLGLSILLEDPTTGATLFDGVDFTLVPDDGQIQDGAPHNLLRRALQSHDFWTLTASREPTDGDG